MEKSKKAMDKDMSFLRDYFRIPSQVKTRWVFIHDNDRERLGLELIKQNKVIDVADACFRQSSQDMNLRPVIHAMHEKGEEFISGSGDKLLVTRDYVRKLYFRRVYSEELMATPLL